MVSTVKSGIEFQEVDSLKGAKHITQTVSKMQKQCKEEELQDFFLAKKRHSKWLSWSSVFNNNMLLTHCDCVCMSD